MTDKTRCNAVVYRRDTYRVSRTGRGRGFKLHYGRGQCSRSAVIGDLCKQHAATSARGFYVLRWEPNR